MLAKLKKRASATSPVAARRPKVEFTLQPPAGLDEHIHRIEGLAKRIDGYIRFMCQIAEHRGMSAEARERAAIAFYEKLIVAEQQLGRIHDEFRLE